MVLLITLIVNLTCSLTELWLFSAAPVLFALPMTTLNYSSSSLLISIDPYRSKLPGSAFFSGEIGTRSIYSLTLFHFYLAVTPKNALNLLNSYIFSFPLSFLFLCLFVVSLSLQGPRKSWSILKLFSLCYWCFLSIPPKEMHLKTHVRCTFCHLTCKLRVLFAIRLRSKGSFWGNTLFATDSI